MQEAATSRLLIAKAKVGDASVSDALRPALLSVLQVGASYLNMALQDHQVVDECPLCEQSVKGEELRKTTKARLADLAVVRQLIEAATVASEAEKTAQSALARQVQVLRRALAELEVRFKESVPSAIAKVGIEHGELTGVFAGCDESEIPPRAIEIAKALIDAANNVQEEYDAVRSRVEVHDNTVDILKRVQENTANVEDNHRLQTRIDQALDIVESTRRSYTEQILGEVRDEVNRLYQAIHPGEDIGLDRFEMDESRRASLNQHARFAGHDGIKPQAYFSESHLDTFGFCLWLALAKRTSQGRGVLVLDDVFTSIDAPHFRRVTDLLADEADAFQQLIIATHNRQWHEFYRQSGVGVHLIKLEKWSIGRGLRAYEEQLAIDDLQEALNADRFDRQAIASQAGILLEALLDDVAVVLGCRLPRSRTNEYTLGQLVDGTTKVFKVARVRRLVADGDDPTWEDTDLSTPFQEVRKLQFIRNQVGAHFNVAGLSLSDRDVETFGQSALALALAIRCAACGQIPSGNRGGHLGCRCKKNQTELTPTKAP